MQSELDDHESVAAGAEPPDRCLSLTVHGPWGHFRRIDGNVVKATYRLPPRTTVAGLLAAIAGYERDGYYDVFDRSASGIAIQPVEVVGAEVAETGDRGWVIDRTGGAIGAVASAPPRTANLPENSLTTSNEGMKTVNARGKVSVRYPDPDADRQRVNYEVLVEPAYRIDVWLDDDDAFDRLRSRLEDGRSEYVPSLGLSEHLAAVEFEGVSEPTPVESGAKPVEVESAVPEPDGIVPQQERPHGTERSPGDMTRTNGDGEFTGRRTTEYLRWAYSRDDDPLPANGVEAYEVDDRVVVFS
jgi:CRISPR-associated protein Cas5h